MFSTFQDAAFFGFGVFFFLVCFACKIFVLVEYKDCKRDWLNERDFLREAYIATVVEHACACVATILCAAGGHWVSTAVGLFLCILHVDEWRRGRAEPDVYVVRARNRAKDFQLYLYIKLAVYACIVLWLALSLWWGLAKFLDENPRHFLQVLKTYSPIQHHVQIAEQILSKWFRR